VYGELTGIEHQVEAKDELWRIVVRCLAEKSPNELAQLVYSLYLEQPYSLFDPTWAPKGATRFGALGVDTSRYNLERNQVKLHFLPTRNAGSDLASSKLPERRKDMKRLLEFVKANHPEIENFTSYTWLQNLPSYQALFPQPFLARLTLMTDKFLGLWGQFVRWDGTANQANFETFTHRLQTATTLDEAVDAFPLKVLGAVGPIQEFYDLYAIN
jgi:hypothetical protein